MAVAALPVVAVLKEASKAQFNMVQELEVHPNGLG